MPMSLFQILALLRPAPSDASSLLESLGELSGGHGPSVPAFYRHLKRGIDEGWIDIDGTETREDGPGRPSQIYRITRDGLEALREHALELQALTRLALGQEGAQQ